MMKAVLGLPLAQAKALLAGKDCEAEFTRPLFAAELAAGEYSLAAYAVNAFGKETLVGEAEFAVEA